MAYFDTSAFVPLIIGEAGSAACREIWQLADRVVSSRLLYVEAAAALAQALSMGRLTGSQHAAVMSALDNLWAALDVVEIDADLISRAAELAFEQGLRGYDAVHCASAERLADPDLVVAAGDRRLLAGMYAIGLATVDVGSS
jgi:predicted nucleic acid-binding protein